VVIKRLRGIETLDIDGRNLITMNNPRTFAYLGPNSAVLDVNMNRTQVMADGTSIRAWTFGAGFNTTGRFRVRSSRGLRGNWSQ